MISWLKLNSNEMKLSVTEQWSMFCSMVSGYIQNLANHLSMVSQTELDESAEITLHDYKNYMPYWSELVSLCFDLEKSEWILNTN